MVRKPSRAGCRRHRLGQFKHIGYRRRRYFAGRQRQRHRIESRKHGIDSAWRIAGSGGGGGTGCCANGMGAEITGVGGGGKGSDAAGWVLVESSSAIIRRMEARISSIDGLSAFAG